MYVFYNFKCNVCEHIFEVCKKKLSDDFFENLKCTECESEDVRRLFHVGDISVAKGRLGNASNGYSKGVTYHPSRYGRYKSIKK